MFVVIYRWKIKPGSEERFRSAWSEATRAIALRYGALGSRLHRADDGDWLAYAQWPSRARWEAMRGGPPADAATAAEMRDCIEDGGESPSPLFCLTVTDDYLVPMKSPD
jgi:heme-degrading monooxygenase HmoA